MYFMREPLGPVKIGITHVGATSLRDFTIDQRRIAIEGASGRRLVTLADTEGSLQIERETHARFDHLRTVGEWFSPGDDLLAYVNSLREPR